MAAAEEAGPTEEGERRCVVKPICSRCGKKIRTRAYSHYGSLFHFFCLPEKTVSQELVHGFETFLGDLKANRLDSYRVSRPPKDN